MKKLICAALALLLVLGLAGCGKKTKPKPEDETSSSSASESAAEELPSDTLVVYSPLPQEVLDAAVAGFTAETSIKVKTVSDSAPALIDRLGKEPAKADVLFGAGAEIVQQAAALFTPYATGEKAALDPAFLSKDDLYTPLTPMPIVLMYSKAQTTQAPTGWSSLANDSYNGWVAFADPQSSGTSYTALCIAAQTKALGTDFIAKLAASMNGKPQEGISDVYKGIAAGKFAAGVTLEGSVHKYLAAGYENTVGIVYPAEGTTAALEVSALVAGTPREEAAQKFIDYVSGTEFQQTLVSNFELRTARNDLDDPEGLALRKDIKFIDYDVAQAVKSRQELLTQWNEAVAKSAPKEEPKK